MASSPFHGIFNALTQSRGRGRPLPDSSAPIGTNGEEGTLGKVAVDIYEQDDYIIIKAPIAGVRMADLDIEVNGNVLTLRGTRKQGETNIPNDQYYLQECFWGPFERKITLPTEIDPRKVKATFNKDCILKILVPKEQKVNIVKISEV